MKLSKIEERVRQILIKTAQGRIQTFTPGLISYKEFWLKIYPQYPWGRGWKDAIVEVIVPVAAFEVSHGRPPLNELVVVAKTKLPGQDWKSIRRHFAKELEVYLPYRSHQEAQNECWAYWNDPSKQSSNHYKKRGGKSSSDDGSVEEAVRQERNQVFLSRNRKIVEMRKQKDKYTCQACAYRKEVNGKFIIDCHHIFPLGDAVKTRVTKLNHLICLCPNCHRIAHSEKFPLNISAIKARLRQKN